MNHNDKKDLVTILNVLGDHQIERRELSDDVKEIKICLMGDSSKYDDLGLQGAVEKNTRFRKSTFKVMWLMVAGMVSSAFFAIKSNFK